MRNDGDGQYYDMSCELEVNIDSPQIRNAVKSLANRLGIKIKEGSDPSVLTVDEDELTTLNHSRAFYTRWEFFLSWEELEVENPDDYDWSLGGLPKWWIQQEAMKSAVDRFNQIYFLFDGEGNITGMTDWETGEEYPFNWDSINQLRALDK